MLAAEQRGVLCQLADAREQFAARQGAAEGDIDEDFERRVESSDVVLASVEADRRLQRRCDIVHRQERGRHVDEFRPTKEHGGEEAGDVHERAAAEGKHEGALGGADTERPLHESRQIPPRFARVAARQHEFVHLRQARSVAAGAGLAHVVRLAALEEGSEVVMVQGVDGLIRDQKNPVGLHIQNMLDHLTLNIRAQPSRHGRAIREDEGQGLHRHGRT
mmetsp:Transcript_11618/g.30056  ORF Transcript_11618/g.30056 Transcript_11618/m.30056 type:complete len:219 (+) Transcript_11618:852-1508(+)